MTHNTLFDYFRSSCAYRVRIALNLKKISYHKKTISLLNHEQYTPEYLVINPQGAVPFWQDEHIALSQSMAILEYLDEQYPQLPKLLPQTITLRAQARQLALIIACDIHPLNNLRVKEYLNWDSENFLPWYHHWLQLGFDGFESLLNQFNYSAPFCLGEQISIADICLIPQIYNALRFKFDMTPYLKIMKIYQHCQKIPAFIEAAPQENS